MECRTVVQDDGRWDEFISAQHAGTFFHLWGWRDVITRSFGHEPFYLCAEQAGEIHGVLPLFLVKSMLFGRSLVALPLAVYGGVVAKCDEARDLLLGKANELAKEHQVRYLEIRGNPYDAYSDAPGACGAPAEWTRKDLYVTFIGAIDSEDDVNLSRIPRKQRRMIRQGQKQGLRSIFDKSKLPDFYQIYAESVRNLGTPVYGYAYFQEILKTFEHQCKLLLVEHEKRAVAGVLGFFYKDQVMPYYSGALKECFHLAPNDFMYWELMSYGAANGFKIFDFGRSKTGTGSYSFKRHWGFEPRPLPYWHCALNGRHVPDASPLNRKLQWAIRLWRSMPLKVTTALGPHIVRHIP